MAKETELIRLLDERMSGKLRASLVWATVKEVDWDAKTMTVTGNADGLEYYEVLLGIGSFYRRPAVGSTCIIAVLESSRTNALLLDAAAFEEGVYTSGNAQLSIRLDGFVVNSRGESFREVMNDLITELNKIVVIHGNSINVAAMIAIRGRLNEILK